MLTVFVITVWFLHLMLVSTKPRPRPVTLKPVLAGLDAGDIIMDAELFDEAIGASAGGERIVTIRPDIQVNVERRRS
jgi:hypothetical protein